MRDWLLICGAGASTARPSGLPIFSTLAAAVLRAVGWNSAVTALEGDALAKHRVWRRAGYGEIDADSVAAEVLFGALRDFGIDFTDQVIEVLSGGEPNALHCVAAQILRAGGCVWTPNVDVQIERACRQLSFEPAVFGRSSARSSNPLRALGRAGAGDLIKFHGTVDSPETLAFTDRQLMAPLPESDVKHLAELARGRRVVLYGYAGMDADLADLIDKVLGDADSVAWFEPRESGQLDIQRAFRQRSIDFRPGSPDDAVTESVARTASEFVDLARTAGAILSDDLVVEFVARQELPTVRPMPAMETPEITHARLAERFGVGPRVEEEGLAHARRVDLIRLPPRAVRGHLRWALNRSIYNDGVAGKLLLRVAQRPSLALALRPLPARDYVVKRACALLLRQGQWRALQSLTDEAVRIRRDSRGLPNPSDLYYRAHAYRNAFQPATAAGDSADAVAGLEDAEDAERLAGALYEAGTIALYQGRFNEALDYAFQLRFRRGRYAIPRWQAWGAWIEVMALCHLDRPHDADEPLRAARRRFTLEGSRALLADVRTAQLVMTRVNLAHGIPVPEDLRRHPDDERRQRRYLDDLDLVMSDIAIAEGQLDDAAQRLQRVAATPASPVSASWAALGLAEIERLTGDPDVAGGAFAEVASDATARGAHWQAAQAVVGMHLCGHQETGRQWVEVRPCLTDCGGSSPEGLLVGSPRVLWMVTL